MLLERTYDIFKIQSCSHLDVNSIQVLIVSEVRPGPTKPMPVYATVCSSMAISQKVLAKPLTIIVVNVAKYVLNITPLITVLSSSVLSYYSQVFFIISLLLCTRQH